jgi:NAD(P)-dependent dehydrogenase (short-subunit alcohol dehydrogenase family)
MADTQQDLTGKTFVVTGANSGIGFEAVKYFAAHGAQLAMICRDEERGRQALSAIKKQTGNEQVRLFVADFSSLGSVRQVARQLLDAYSKIDVLCNNAGGANAARQVTEEGFELTLVTNHLSSFLLTKLLLPALLEAAETASARVLFTSSLGHKNSALEFDNLNLERAYSWPKAYGRSKLMNLLTARELQRRYADKNLVASSFHPGAVRTPIWSKGGAVASLIGIFMYPFMRSIKKGADTFIWLASSNDPAAVNANGQYFFDRRQASIADFATDAAAQKLWLVSEELVAPFLIES